MTQVDKRINFKAIDNVSGVVDKISGKFPKLSKGAARAQQKFDRLSKSSAAMKRNLSSLGNGMKSVGVGMTAAITLPVVAFGAAALKTTMEFDKSMNKVQSLSGATGKEFKKLEGQALKLGSATSFSAKEAAEAQAFFAQAGFKTAEIMKAVPAALNLASASQTDLATTSDILSNIMGGFNIKAKDAAKVSDVLAKATARGNINLSMMGETMKDAAPVALKFGASVEEVSALTAKLGDAGIQGSKAGTTLKNMFIRLAAPTSRIKKIMGSLGVETIDKTTGKMRKMTDILVDMNKSFKAKGLSSAKRLAVLNEVFGKRAIAGAGVLLNAVESIDPATGKVTNTVAKLTKELEGATGAADEMRKINEQGLPGAIARLSSAWSGFQIKFMKSGIGDMLESIMNKLAEFLGWLSSLSDSTLKWIGIIAGVLAVVGPLLVIFGSIIAALPLLIAGFEALSVIFALMSSTLVPLLISLAPFILAAGIIAATGIAIYKNWSGIKSIFTNLFTDPLAELKDMAKYAASLAGVAGFFGVGEKTDEELFAEGAAQQKNKKPWRKTAGDPTGSKELTKKNFEYEQRKQQASVDVKFSNLPKETRVMTDDKDSILNVDSGMMGAF
jgi:TP901 family phage tail tape measure protein